MSRTSPCFEVRLYGLHPSVTTSALDAFFSTGVTVLGTLIHPPESAEDGAQGNHTEARSWAQVWTASEAEVQKCLGLKGALGEKGISIARAPGSIPQTSPGWLSPDFSPSPMPFAPPSTPIRLDFHPFNRYNAYAQSQPTRDPINLARNLYILGIPIDMTQHQFKALFVPYGMVEHSTLLSQLDGAGRRRGFVLMSTHQEATAAMEAMNGRIVEGYRIDISWALVQREAKHFQTVGALPNRVIHPPAVPTRREAHPDCSVLVENLDPVFFPNAAAVRDLFSHFGPVVRVTVIPGEPMAALLAFEHKVCADALVRSNGMNLGGRPIYTKYLAGGGGSPNDKFEPDLGFDSRPLPILNPFNTDIKAFHPSSSGTDRNSPNYVVTPQHSSSPPGLRCNYSSSDLNLLQSLGLDDDDLQVEPSLAGTAPRKASLNLNKLNPESQEFVPSEGAGPNLSSSPTKSSTETRIDSGSDKSSASMKGWEAAKKLWNW